MGEQANLRRLEHGLNFFVQVARDTLVQLDTMTELNSVQRSGETSAITNSSV